MSAANPLIVPEDDHFGRNNLPYGVFSTADDADRRRLGVRYGDHVLDLGAAARALGSAHADLLTAPSLNPLLAAGRPVWSEVRAELRRWLDPDADERTRSVLAPLLLPLSHVTLHLPFEVADYVDFYASEHHATNVGRLFRPNGDPLTPNWKHLPIGYHGRAGTVVVSGTPVVRPLGQRKAPDEEVPSFGPSRKLDIEAEVGFVVGTPTRLGEPVPQTAFRDHVFGVCLVNDWSARDVQAWEYVPLGPFLGKSFATSVSAWITPLDALDAARTTPPPRTHALLPYLDDADDGIEPGGFDVRITVSINGEVVSEPPFGAMYWTAAQQLAHMTVNGASLRTGDFYASGTVSGPEKHQRGCLLELTWGGREPLKLPEGERTFLEDGDEVTLTAWAPGPEGERIGLGEVVGRIVG
ncbi:fumarylacetoacetase [Streptomyces alkaliterrae]|uniref:fumarylacetoacetase n=1 Tax=Streptomyces alkaliterrae TaxID=2213162 RepID=A0A5P0YS82_9ACTN|nr:fumarylacetoacetase [Streptomyces alkaliterrae]MBB1254262.1 fumarylacetoacetase [Streptomyces alkaliterrae]MBB1259615.1 fumarylacetoacetase [Streptomyces alkaliterrae]MQS03183.1 fumarylacetoacetase [Streptomyces alkaliterrae]